MGVLWDDPDRSSNGRWGTLAHINARADIAVSTPHPHSHVDRNILITLEVT